jgi:hypothetical protein
VLKKKHQPQEVEPGLPLLAQPTVHLSKVKSITRMLGLGGWTQVLKVWKDTLAVHLLRTVLIRLLKALSLQAGALENTPTQITRIRASTMTVLKVVHPGKL